VRPSARSLALFAFAGATLLGCDRIQRVRECRAIVRPMNARIDAIHAQAKNGKPGDYRAAAASYGLLAGEVRLAVYSSPAGQALKEEYAATLETIAPLVDTYATALESGDAQRIDEARRGLERVRRTEQSVAKRLDAHCKP
jgi:hypothetical protein